VLNNIIGRSKLYLLLCSLVVVFFGAQLANLKINPTTYLLSPDHPARVVDSELSEIFTATGASVSVVLTPISGSIYQTSLIKSLENLTIKLQNLNLVNDVDIEQLRALGVDQTSSTIVASIIEQKFTPYTKPEIEKLKSYLLSNNELTEKQSQFLGELVIYVDPVRSVDSLTNFQDIVDIDDNLDVLKLMETPPKTQQDLDEIKRRVGDNPLIQGAFVSRDEKAFNIGIELNASNDDASIVTRAHQKIVAELQNVEGDFNIHVGGTTVVINALNHYLQQDNNRFFPLVLLVIVIVLALSFKTFEGVYIPLLVAVASLVCTLGFLPLLGIKQNMITTMLPIFIMATAVADSIHVLNRFYRELPGANGNVKDAINRTYRGLLKALGFTTITTALGFLALSYTDIVFIKEFGIFVALGVVFAFLFTLFLIPSLLLLKPVRKLSLPSEQKVSVLLGLINSVADGIWWMINKHRSLVVIVVLMIAGLGMFFSKEVNVDYEGIEMYPESAQIRQDNAIIKKHFQSVVPLSIRLDGEENGAIFQKDVIQYITDVENKLSKHPNIGYIISPNSYLERMNQVLNDGPKGQLPEDLSSALASQYYLLYDNSTGQDIRDVVDNAYRHGRIVVMLDTDRATVSRDVINLVEAIPKPSGLDVSFASIAGVIVYATEEVVNGQIASLLISSILVLVIMSVLFRSIVIGFAAVIPLALTLLINFGMLGGLQLDLDVATSLIAAIVLGVGIDYGIHFIESVKQSMNNGLCKNDALALAVRTVSPPIIINSLSLAGGFMVLMISSFQPLVYLGGLIAMTMIVSALATSIVLPILLDKIPMGKNTDESAAMPESKSALNT